MAHDSLPAVAAELRPARDSDFLGWSLKPRRIYLFSVLTPWNAHREGPAVVIGLGTVSASAAVEDSSYRSVDYELVLHRPVGSIASCLRQS